ncbi:MULTISPECIES: TnsA-like heteromeric transposase endonuclease subunit [unclassified Rhodococcus (in: high G+C Gram-positive bacteria)]|uniref:TnsA-like heteromeric transposase endonuclease subunit n=1 Tax=unclassified Rhodococcus (in: high G+C Gram-positive bacteria) TaxID=192944 RepID=UPI00037663D2
MLGETAQLSRADDEFEAVFLTGRGVERRVPWRWLPEVVDELERPVRSFPSYRGQRNYPGWYWACTVGRLIGFESWVERDHLVALDFDASVVGIVSQPFWLLWTSAEGKSRRYAPDFVVRSADGTVAVLDSRQLHSISERDREAFDATGRACATVGWRYAVWDRMDAVVVANQRWLAGYRHPRCFDETAATRLLGVFTTPRPLMDGAEMAGDPLGTLPVLYHLLWKQLLVADLAVVLSHRTIVRTASTANSAQDLVGGGVR